MTCAGVMTPAMVGVMTPTETLDADGTHAVACRCDQCTEDLDFTDCVCVHSCEDDPATQCDLSGQFHVHSDLGRCPVHPDALES